LIHKYENMYRHIHTENIMKKLLLLSLSIFCISSIARGADTPPEMQPHVFTTVEIANLSSLSKYYDDLTQETLKLITSQSSDDVSLQSLKDAIESAFQEIEKPLNQLTENINLSVDVILPVLIRLKPLAPDNYKQIIKELEEQAQEWEKPAQHYTEDAPTFQQEYQKQLQKQQQEADKQETLAKQKEEGRKGYVKNLASAVAFNIEDKMITVTPESLKDVIRDTFEALGTQGYDYTFETIIIPALDQLEILVPQYKDDIAKLKAETLSH
jgi:hypothetical protein